MLNTNIRGYDHKQATNTKPSGGISDDSLDENKEHCLKNKIKRRRKFTYKNLSEPRVTRRTEPLRKAISCTSCDLCEYKDHLFDSEDEAVFPIRKVASCSMCDWDYEEPVLEQSSSGSEGEYVLETPANDSTPFMLTRQNSYSKKWTSPQEENDCDGDTSLNDESYESTEITSAVFMATPHKNLEVAGNSQIPLDENEGSFDYISPIKRRNSYKSAQEGDDIPFSNSTDEDVTNERNHSIIRSPPDGGEASDIERDAVHHIDRKYDSNKSNENGKNYNNTKEIVNTSNSRNLIKKTFSFKRKKVSRKSAATKELDEIFGKVQITPQTSFEKIEEEDKFNATENSITKKNSKIFGRLLPPRRRPLFTKRKPSNLSSNKSRSVEVLYADDTFVRNNNLQKAQSTLEISSALIYESDEFSEQINESWINYLNRIDGMSLLGGNPNLRYIWHQIGCQQSELLQPFEDFLRGTIDQMEQAYIKCQELETALARKNHQQEREAAKIYDEVELIIQQERSILQEKYLELEEQIRYEANRLLESRDLEIRELIKRNEDNEYINNRLQQEYHDLKADYELAENQINQLTSTEISLRKENERLMEKHGAQDEKIKESAETIKELQEHIIQITRITEVEKEKYRQCFSQFQDVIEEKEYLDINLKNLSTEIDDLKGQNKSLLEQISATSSSNMTSIMPSNISNGDIRYNSDISQNNNSMYNNYDEDDSSYFDDSFTPKIQTPSGLKPMQITVDENGERTNNTVKFAHLEKHSRNLFSESTPKRRFKNTVKSPLKFASSSQREFKVIFTGDINVGKTSLVRRIHSGKFRTKREATIEADYYLKTVEFHEKKVPLKLWDTVGQERFRSLPPSYFRRSDVVILMYDIEEESTFINAKAWIKIIHEHTDENIFLILVGHKSDMHHKRQVISSRGLQLAKNHDAMFVEASAKSGENVDELCDMIASTLLDRDDTVIIRSDFGGSLCSLNYSHKRKSLSTCCQ